MRESRVERGLKLTLLGLLAAAALAAPFAPTSITGSTVLALSGLVVGIGVLIWAAVLAARRNMFGFAGAILEGVPASERQRVRRARRRGEAVSEQLGPVLVRYAHLRATNEAGTGWSLAGIILVNAHNLAGTDSFIPAPVNTLTWVAMAAAGVWADHLARDWRRLGDAQEARVRTRARQQWTP